MPRRRDSRSRRRSSRSYGYRERHRGSIGSGRDYRRGYRRPDRSISRGRYKSRSSSKSRSSEEFDRVRSRRGSRYTSRRYRRSVSRSSDSSRGRYHGRERSSHDRYRRRHSYRDGHRHTYRGRHRRSHNRDRPHHKRKASPKDRIIHFSYEPGMHLGDYKVIRKIADGTFGRVLLCEKDGVQFAVKVVRDVEKYVKSAKIEVEILQDIQKVDGSGESHCVVLHDHFMYKGRIMCLVFERLGDSLYEFLKANDYKGFFMSDIQRIAFQLLKGLSFLKQNKLIHTDLKPENVLLTCGHDDFIEVPFPRSTTGMLTKRPATADIKIIDFGSTIYEDDYHSSIINTRQYRSPEVILDLGWSYASDMWSLGCILVELYTGDLLFGTHSHLEHLAMMERTVGPLPSSMLAEARNTEGRDYLHPTKDSLNWPEGAQSSSSEERVSCCRSVMEIIRPEHRPFAEFIKYILNPDPSQRPTPEDAMEHEFFVLTLAEG
ncbi:Protein kinase domain family protein [Babesia bovis T2Bo]|uniref:Protein serine/threonine kinase 1 n=1 Tax=Babesia bovis TaxID=5865 RepID=A7AV94_BABBO|nr:Protein kinase domain family protein [Babesia bovis T2Bo]EDO05720.1 Protein kinase domain family protein [Babesia bovis T2Bo]|eukprot:XP_001609288.1 protein serine/threonine kinase 1 [Babesia bovis T2Bo]